MTKIFTSFRAIDILAAAFAIAWISAAPLMHI